jgi:deoxyribonuclease-4
VKKLKKLFFGTAGIPLSTPMPATTINGIKQVKKLGLNAMELEFVKNVNISKEKTIEVKKTAENNEIILTCHGQYFINLNAIEEKKINSSIKRILHASKIASMCGAWSITFHMAYYLNKNPLKVHEKVKTIVKNIVKELKNEGHEIWLRPETTGKHSQYGTLEETIKLSQEIEQVQPCIDFAHLHARSNGLNNSFQEFREILSKIEQGLGKEALKNLHCHVSGINYSEKGEKNHLSLQESDFNFKELIKALKEFKCCGIIISESPNIEKDALILKKEFEKN